MFQPGIGRGLSLPMHVSTTIRRSPTSRISVCTDASACPFGARNGPSQPISARFSTVASRITKRMSGASSSCTRVMRTSPICQRSSSFIA